MSSNKSCLAGVVVGFVGGIAVTLACVRSQGAEKAIACDKRAAAAAPAPAAGAKKQELAKSSDCAPAKKDEDERAADRTAFWFVENLTSDFQVRLSLKNVLFEGRSKFQRLQVITTAQFGKTLLMDGCTQSAEIDEHIYHETLVHPAMLLHPNPKAVFVGGGGEFATAREVLRHKSVERCVMVDLDKEACDICRKELPTWNAGAYDDPRFHVEYDDARKWLQDHEEKFDVIILDICDPIEAGPAYPLYTAEFYEFLKTRMNDGAVLVTQSGPGAMYNAKSECFTVIHSTLRSVYQHVAPFAADIPSFGCNWGFNLVSGIRQSDDSAVATSNPVSVVHECSIADTDKLIAERINGTLKYLDGVSWRGLFGIPKEIRDQCRDEERVMTMENPVFMYTSKD